MSRPPLLSVSRLSTLFTYGKRKMYAVKDVSFDIEPGQTFGLVGESGCGKSTLAKTLVRLIDPAAGSIYFNGFDLLHCTKSELMEYRRDIQMIFQDPFASLNPRMTAEEIIAEPLIIYGMDDQIARKERVRELLFLVGLHQHHASYFPHELSGGQRQRICIARALALHPKLIICDESIAALDVSVQAQIINLLKDLQKKMGLSYLFISHDLSVVRYLCDQVAVMYLGQIVEQGPTNALFSEPRHPYTQALLAAIPQIPQNGEALGPLKVLEGEVPSALSPPKGCPFSTRCVHAHPICTETCPRLLEKSPEHFVSCHL
ncbi:MAG: ATP-binding cassette domain-containing protein [Simkaniaceae bacterium]|nr:ATP-binding cassette domain-containing protein [Simkaniaceae bacterium]